MVRKWPPRVRHSRERHESKLEKQKTLLLIGIITTPDNRTIMHKPPGPPTYPRIHVGHRSLYCGYVSGIARRINEHRPRMGEGVRGGMP